MSNFSEFDQSLADQNLRNSFQNWDADLPSEQVWNEIDESLSIASVWSKIDEDLEAQGSTSDQWIASSFQTWFPSEEKDGWLRMENELSRERIWRRLSASLNQPIQTAIPWFQRAVAAILMMFTSFFINDVQPINPTTGSSFRAYSLALNSVSSNSTELVDETVLISNSENDNTSTESVERKEFVAQQEVEFTTEVQSVYSTDFLNQIAALYQARSQEPVYHTLNHNTSSDVFEYSNEKIAMLGVIQPTFETGTIEYAVRPKPVRFSRPIWSLELGTQLSILTEANSQSLSSALPKFGFAADLGFHRQIGRIKFVQSFGFSQYSQSNGKYLNGRYSNSEQILNTLQATSTIGFEYKRFTAFGGVLFSRLLNGTEQNASKITNVYDAKSIQVGLAAGLDARIKQFKNGNSINLGVQYQWIPTLKSENAEFENIQGIRFQTKILF